MIVTPNVSSVKSRLVTHAEAKAIGAKLYFTGIACPLGHIAMRRTSTAQCTECVRLAVREYKKKNRASLTQSQKAYYATNKKPYVEWRERNRDKPVYKKANSARAKRWSANNPDKVRVLHIRRRARLRGATGTHTADDIADIRRMQRDRCAEPTCRRKLRGEGHVDHIVPLSRGGTNDRRNLQLLCPACNMHKHTTDPLTHARRLGRLL